MQETRFNFFALGKFDEFSMFCRSAIEMMNGRFGDVVFLLLMV